MKYLTNIDLNQNQLINAVLQKLATDPSSPVSGQIYYNTATNILKFYNGTIWKGASEMTGEDIITAINASTGSILDARLSATAQTAITNTHTHSNKTILDNITAAFTTTYETKLNAIEASADVTDSTNVGTAVYGSTAKTTLADADQFAIIDSAASNVLKKITYANVKTLLNALYNNYVHPTTDGSLHVPATSTTNNGKILIAGATAGVFAWGTNAPDWANITNKPTSTVANIDDAVTKRHTQNTDTGTTSATFTVGSSGVKVKNSGGTELQVRNNGDTDYGDIRVKNLYVEGTTTTINSNTVNIGDSEIELNSDIVASASNSDGGIAIKRLMADNTTRKDAKFTYNNSTGKWQTTQGDVTGTLVTANITNKVVATVGDASATSYLITHNLNTLDLTVSIRESASPFAMVITDVEFTSANTITVKFATAPTLNQYTITIIG